MRKKLFLVALFTLALTFATSLFALVGCGDDNEPADNGVYYLSVLDEGTWTNYTSNDNVPADKKFVKDNDDDNIYTLSVDLQQGASVKIAKVGSEKTYGGDQLFSSLTALSKGDDNAISVAESGTFELKLDVTGEGEVSYKFTPKAQQTEVKVVLVEIDEAADFTLTFGDTTTKQLSATATLSNETNSKTGITWESSAPAVATVDENGLVTAVAAGTAQIKAKSGNVESDAVTVTVNGSVTLSETSLRLSVNGEATLTYEALGGATVGEWTSTDETVATVEDGKVTALKTGTATIRLSYTPRAGATPLFATCEVNVNVPASAITLNNNAISVAVGSTATLTVGFKPADTTNKNYTFEVTEGSEYVTVAKSDTDGSKLTVTPVAQGTAKITVTSEDGNFTATCDVTVVAEGTVTANLSASSLTLNKTGLNNTATLTVDVTGDTASSVTWSSSRTGVATVSTEGVVTSVAFGTTVITAAIETEGGTSFEKTCTVLVAPEHFFLYGAIGTDAWTTELTKLEAQKMIFTGSSDGIYTLTCDLPASKDFRIGDDDDFGTAWVGVNYAHLGSKQDNVVRGGRDAQHNVYNMQVSKAGTYTFTLDITGATPSLSVVCDAITISSIELSTDKSTLKATDTDRNVAVITLTVNPSDATYIQDDVQWTCESSDVTVERGNNQFTVTVKDTAASGKVTITCQLKGKTATVNLTILAADAQDVAVSTIEFEQSAYKQNVNGNPWEVTVSASVDAEATNQDVTYSTTDSGVTVDANTGLVTATKVGTYTITATAAGDTTKTATATVTFYSDMFYLTGNVNGWPSTHPSVTTVGTDFEKYTFTATDDTNMEFTLDVAMESGAFQIAFVGGDWANSWDTQIINGNTATVSGDASKDGGNFKVSSDGNYQVKINISGVTPAITVTRTGDIPSFTATLKGGAEDVTSEASTFSNAKYTMIIKTAFTAGTTYTLQVSGGNNVSVTVDNVTNFSGNDNFFENGTNGFKCIAEGTYNFTIVCDASGTTTVTVVKVIEYPYSILVNDVEVAGAVLVEGENNEYTFYFSSSMTAWAAVKFTVAAKNSNKSATAQWASDYTLSNASGKVQYTNESESNVWLYDSINGNWNSVQSSNTGTMFCALVFTVDGEGNITLKSLTTADSSLVPSTEA